MLFNSYHFLIFFPLVVILYYAIPQKVRWIWLLVTSLYFYGCWNKAHVILLTYAILVSWIGGLLIKKLENKIAIRKTVLALAVTACFSSLFVFKYGNWILTGAGLGRLPITVPMGISFYTFQAVSYLVDVYRNKVNVQKNILRYALYVSFFPQLVAGPIERSERLMPQVDKEHKFDFDNLRTGFILMLWGYFLKIIIADRASMIVDTVYGDVYSFAGIYVILATALFAFQIYCDFAGYSMIAMGSAKILGFELMENFDAPYLSKSVSEFWRRWHISLSSWFKDYVYIPLGGSRKGKLRKCINIMVVFLLSGLWHGADLSYVIWGGLNGLYHLVEEFSNGLTKKIPNIIRIIITFILVDFAWFFFRAETMSGAGDVLNRITDLSWVSTGLSMQPIGIDKANGIVLLIALIILVIADVLKDKKTKVMDVLCKQNTIIGCTEIIAAILFLLIFGIYGSSVSGTFIYFQF